MIFGGQLDIDVKLYFEGEVLYSDERRPDGMHDFVADKVTERKKDYVCVLHRSCERIMHATPDSVNSE